MEIQSIINKFRQKSMLRTGAIYSMSSSLSAVAAMVVGFANMRWLGPELLGIWQSITIINSYLPFLQLGIQSGLNVDLPIILGEGNQERANKYIGTAKAFARMLSFFISLIGTGVVVFLLCNNSDIKITVGVAAIVYMAVISCHQLHLIATYRTASAFDRLSKIYLVDAVVTLLLLFFIYKYLYYGLIIYNVVKETVKLVLMHYYAPYRKTRPLFDKSVFFSLFKRGAVLMALNQLTGVLGSLPRLILLTLGGVVQVGLFSPALAVHGLIGLIPSQLVQFLQPQMGFKYGKSKCAMDMRSFINKLTLYVPLVTLPFAIVGWVLIAPVLQYIFPKYIESIWAIRIMLVGFMFSSTSITSNFLITIKAYKQILYLYGIQLILFTSLPIIFIRILPCSILTSMSLGLSAGYFLFYFINYIVIAHTIRLPRFNI